MPSWNKTGHKPKLSKKKEPMIPIEPATIYHWENYSFKNYIILTEAEKKQLLEWRNDATIRKHMYSTEPIPLEHHLAFIDGLSQRTDRYYWMVSDEHKIVGSMNLTDVDAANGTAELGYFLRPDLIGSGEGFFFVFSQLAFAFEQLGLHALYGAIHADNASATLIDNYLGFKKTGEKMLIVNGVETLFVEHVITASDFLNNKEEKRDLDNFIRFMRQQKKR